LFFSYLNQLEDSCFLWSRRFVRHPARRARHFTGVDVISNTLVLGYIQRDRYATAAATATTTRSDALSCSCPSSLSVAAVAVAV
jgi:hypothetical protein